MVAARACGEGGAPEVGCGATGYADNEANGAAGGEAGRCAANRELLFGAGGKAGGATSD